MLKQKLNQENLRLSSWKMKLLSFGGRLTLVKSVLGSLPIYFLSLFRAPSMVLKELERKRRNFFWGGSTENGNKMAWVKWDKILAPKESGGLGVGSLKAFNLALLGKWWGRFHTDKTALWVKIISSIYGEHGCLEASNESTPPSGYNTVWNDIRIAGGKINELGVEFTSSWIKVIGDGSETKFWKDKWVNDCTLDREFPRLFHLQSSYSIYDTNALISDCGFWSDRIWRWRWPWEEQVRGRSQNELERLKQLVETVPISRNKRDEWIWRLDPINGFTVASLRYLIEERLGDRDVDATPMVWSTLVPRKVTVFIWRMRNKGIPVRVEIDNRGIDLDTVLCPMCQNEPEDIFHCILHCSMTRNIWLKVFDWWGNSSPNIENILRDILFGTANGISDSIYDEIWKATVWISAYCVWRTRNNAVFGRKITNPDECILLIKDQSYRWINARLRKKNLMWNIWNEHPNSAVS